MSTSAKAKGNKWENQIAAMQKSVGNYAQESRASKGLFDVVVFGRKIATCIQAHAWKANRWFRSKQERLDMEHFYDKYWEYVYVEVWKKEPPGKIRIFKFIGDEWWEEPELNEYWQEIYDKMFGERTTR